MRLRGMAGLATTFAVKLSLFSQQLLRIHQPILGHLNFFFLVIPPNKRETGPYRDALIVLSPQRHYICSILTWMNVLVGEHRRLFEQGEVEP